MGILQLHVHEYHPFLMNMEIDIFPPAHAWQSSSAINQIIWIETPSIRGFLSVVKEPIFECHIVSTQTSTPHLTNLCIPEIFFTPFVTFYNKTPHIT